VAELRFNIQLRNTLLQAVAGENGRERERLHRLCLPCQIPTRQQSSSIAITRWWSTPDDRRLLPLDCEGERLALLTLVSHLASVHCLLRRSFL
jgi:hypothetical protein